MRNDGERLIYIFSGSIGAIVLGMLLVPLREATTASNLTYPFLALIIAIAEFGGSIAAVATAVCAALSLNFFLTEPYLRLTIHHAQDVVAFAGLAACGLVAAAFAGRRREGSEARSHLELLRFALNELHSSVSIEATAARLLTSATKSLPIDGAVLRDAQGEIVAMSEGGRTKPVPARTLEATDPMSANALRDGARITLRSGHQPVGMLDVWGDGTRSSAEALRALSDVATLMSELMASRIRVRRAAH